MISGISMIQTAFQEAALPVPVFFKVVFENNIFKTEVFRKWRGHF